MFLTVGLRTYQQKKKKKKNCWFAQNWWLEGIKWVLFVVIGIWNYKKAGRDKAGGDGDEGCGVQGNASSSWDCKTLFSLSLPHYHTLN